MPRKPKPPPLPPLSVMTVEEVAEVLGISVRTLHNWSKVPGWPSPWRPPYKLPPLVALARQRWEAEASTVAPTRPGSLSDKARARRLDIMADLSALELAKRLGEMLARADCFATFYEFAGAVKVAAEAYASTAPEAVVQFNKLLEGQQRDLALRYPEPVARRTEKDERETA